MAKQTIGYVECINGEWFFINSSEKRFGPYKSQSKAVESAVKNGCTKVYSKKK